MWWFLLLLMETPQEHAARVRDQMQASIAAQRVAVQKQSAISHPAPFLVSAAPATSEQPPCDPLPAPELASLVNSAAERQSLNPSLIREVARRESGFFPCAVSRQGAMGLMQLMPVTQVELGVSDPWDARQSIEAGSQLLRQLLDRYHGDLSLALSAYNAGASRVDWAGGIPAIPETRNYVESILFRLLPGTGIPLSGFSPGALFDGLAGGLRGGSTDGP